MSQSTSWEYSEERWRQEGGSEERNVGGKASRQCSRFSTKKRRRWALGSRISVLNSWWRRNKARRAADGSERNRKEVEKIQRREERWKEGKGRLNSRCIGSGCGLQWGSREQTRRGKRKEAKTGRKWRGGRKSSRWVCRSTRNRSLPRIIVGIELFSHLHSWDSPPFLNERENTNTFNISGSNHSATWESKYSNHAKKGG